MINIYKNRLVALIIICFALFIGQSFTVQKQDDDDKPKNLKILPKDISEDSLHLIMREYSKSLGVRCGFCHERKEGAQHPDFASDAKPEKNTARKMMTMVDNINKSFIDKIGEGNFEHITCVTCHMGNIKPMVSVDSLPKKPFAGGDSLRRPPFPSGADTLMNKPPAPQK